MAVPVCRSTCILANTALSVAKSASSILDRAAEVCSVIPIRLEIVCSNRFWRPPTHVRTDAKVFRAESMPSKAPEASLDRSILYKLPRPPKVNCSFYNLNLPTSKNFFLLSSSIWSGVILLNFFNDLSRDFPTFKIISFIFL